MRYGRGTLSVFPLFGDQNGKGVGGGTLHIKPNPDGAYHKNSLGAAHYTHGIFYSPVSHTLKVWTGGIAHTDELILLLRQSVKALDTLRTEPQTVISAKRMYEKAVEVKDYMLDETSPVRKDGRQRDAPVSLLLLLLLLLFVCLFVCLLLL
jgi:hypothetical protein